jgi:hypothetical protein
MVTVVGGINIDVKGRGDVSLLPTTQTLVRSHSRGGVGRNIAKTSRAWGSKRPSFRRWGRPLRGFVIEGDAPRWGTDRSFPTRF